MGKYLICVSGASGAVYARRCIEALLERSEEVHAVFSDWALQVFREEQGISVPDWLCSINFPPKNLYSADDLFAPPASGSWPLDGTAIVPCSMSSLGAIANGTGNNLLHRAAAVALKEGRPLVIVPRETPLSLIDLRNMTRLAEAGAAILPASPAFYHKPQSIDELADFIAGKILDKLGVADRAGNELFNRWKGREA